jgi:hypothetical protein
MQSEPQSKGSASVFADCDFSWDEVKVLEMLVERVGGDVPAVRQLITWSRTVPEFDGQPEIINIALAGSDDDIRVDVEEGLVTLPIALLRKAMQTGDTAEVQREEEQ